MNRAHEENLNSKFMVVVTDEKKQLYASRPLAPKPDHAHMSSDTLKKLYFTTTTKSTFVPKEIPVTESFSDVHKAAQRVPVNYKVRAPFWSRDMSRYHQSFIPLPLEGSQINKELASTFHPDDSAASAASRGVSVPLAGRTRYTEDFASNVIKGTDYRLPAFRPKISKHVREDDHLVYTDSVTHEKFQDLSHLSKPREAFRPPLDKPTNASAGFKFSASTRYAEEYLDLSKASYRPQPVRGSENSSRVRGSAIPNHVKAFISENEISDLSALPKFRDILSHQTAEPPRERETFSAKSNPYIQEFMHAYE